MAREGRAATPSTPPQPTAHRCGAPDRHRPLAQHSPGAGLDGGEARRAAVRRAGHVDLAPAVLCPRRCASDLQPKRHSASRSLNAIVQWCCLWTDPVGVSRSSAAGE